jgi:hypothetical protein
VGGVGWDTWSQMLLSSSEDESDVGERVPSLWRGFLVNVVVELTPFAFELWLILVILVNVRRLFFNLLAPEFYI